MGAVLYQQGFFTFDTCMAIRGMDILAISRLAGAALHHTLLWCKYAQ